jgi:hypothetical protein
MRQLRLITMISLIHVFSLNVHAQQVTDFESFGVAKDSFINNAGISGGFEHHPVFLPNVYNPIWDSWSGWSISAVRDTIMPGFSNQYSAIPGSGLDGSNTYAVGFSSSGNQIKFTEQVQLEGLYVTNSTYVYYSLKDGDAFAKKFGGETGNDPDSLLLSISKYLDGELGEEEVNVYLADFRFSDNTKDYITKGWEYVDLKVLGNADSLLFTLTSSDQGPFGMNTPAYFCIDNLAVFANTTADNTIQPSHEVEIYPNPAYNDIMVVWPERFSSEGILFNITGSQLGTWNLEPGENHFTLQHLPKGTYFLRIADQKLYSPVMFTHF